MNDDHSASRRADVLAAEARHLLAEGGDWRIPDEPIAANARRAQAAQVALLHFPLRQDDVTDPAALEEAVADLICDLLHLLSLTPDIGPGIVRPQQVVNRGLRHFFAEIREEETWRRGEEEAARA
jgi:hypothetical protein